jgi:superfamily II DNA helicase RecQ
MVQHCIDHALAAPLKSIVFVPTLSWLFTLLDVFSETGRSVFIYYSDLHDDLKTKSLSDFADHDRSILVTTTALSCGLNVTDVSDVIVFSEVSCTESLLQFGGRAARHGEHGRCLFVSCKKSVFIMSQRARNQSGVQQVVSLINSRNFAAALYACYEQ